MLAYAAHIARLSSLAFSSYLFLRLLFDFVVAMRALSKCEKGDVAQTIRALAEYRHRK